MATITRSARTLRAKARFYRSEDGKHAAAARRSFKRAANRAERRAIKAEEDRLRLLASMGEDEFDDDDDVEIDDEILEEDEAYFDDDEEDLDDMEDEEFESDSHFEDITEDNDDELFL